MKTISWPTAAVLVAGILVMGALTWKGLPVPAVISGAVSTLFAALLPSLLGGGSAPPPPEPPGAS
jgi:hypothetical protein